MTLDRTHGASTAGMALAEARAVLADLPHHRDATALDACAAIYDHPAAEPEERADAAETFAILVERAS